MRSRLSICLVLGLLVSASTLVASERFTIEAKLKPNSTSGSYLCAVQVLEHPGGTTVIEQELTVAPGKPAVGRTGTQDGKGGEVDRKIECSISADGRSVAIKFTNRESQKGESDRLSIAERKLQVQ